MSRVFVVHLHLSQHLTYSSSPFNCALSLDIAVSSCLSITRLATTFRDGATTIRYSTGSLSLRNVLGQSSISRSIVLLIAFNHRSFRPRSVSRSIVRLLASSHFIDMVTYYPEKKLDHYIIQRQGELNKAQLLDSSL